MMHTPDTVRTRTDPASDMLLAELQHHLIKLYPPVIERSEELDGIMARLIARLDER